MRKIIADSSSLILLFKCGAAEDLLNNCCCIIPEPVRDELTAQGHDGSDFFDQCIRKGALTVKIHAGGAAISISLHKGEMGVISLYNEGAGQYIIIDDGRGAAFCRNNTIPYINALLAVKILFFSGIISRKKFDVAYLWLKSNGRYSKAVIEWADAAGFQELKEFLL